jgi:hypothetical protein
MSTYQNLKDRTGQTIARIEDQGYQLQIYNRSGQVLGRFDKSMNATYNVNGQRVGTGNLLTMLLS